MPMTVFLILTNDEFWRQRDKIWILLPDLENKSLFQSSIFCVSSRSSWVQNCPQIDSQVKHSTSTEGPGLGDSYIRAGSLITAVFYCSNNDILNKYLRYGCVHMQMAVYAGHYSGHYSENYSKQFWINSLFKSASNNYFWGFLRILNKWLE